MWARAGWPVTLEAGEIVLRPIRRRDGADWERVRQRNSSWLSPWEATCPEPGEGVPNFPAMVRALRKQATDGTALPFIIAERDSVSEPPVLAGQLTVSGIVWGSARSASLGYWVDRERAGRGIAPTAVALATDYCFRELGLHRMEINIRPENRASLRVVEKLGFRDEGVRRRYLHIAGRWADHRSFALTVEDVPDGILTHWIRQRSGD